MGNIVFQSHFEFETETKTYNNNLGKMKYTVTHNTKCVMAASVFMVVRERESSSNETNIFDCDKRDGK